MNWEKIALAILRTAREIDGFDIDTFDSMASLRDQLEHDEFQALMTAVAAADEPGNA